jgi:hypothetical protein
MFTESVSALGQAEPVAKLNVDVASPMRARPWISKTVSPRRTARARDRTSNLEPCFPHILHDRGCGDHRTLRSFGGRNSQQHNLDGQRIEVKYVRDSLRLRNLVQISITVVDGIARHRCVSWSFAVTGYWRSLGPFCQALPIAHRGYQIDVR